MSYSIGDGMVSLALAGGVVSCIYMKHRSRMQQIEAIHQERLVAMEKGLVLPEFALEPERREPDQRILPIMGTVFYTLSVGAMAVLYVSLPSQSHSLWIMPVPLALLGVGLAAYHFIRAGTAKDERGSVKRVESSALGAGEAGVGAPQVDAETVRVLG